MTDPEPAQIPPLPPQRTLYVFGTTGSVPGTLPPWRQLPFFALMPFVSFVSILGMNTGPMQAMVGAGFVAGFYWLLFLRLNPRMVGLALIPIILVPYYNWTDKLPNSIYPTLWMAAAALAGGAGAWLTRNEAREDDKIFIPPAVCALAFVVLVWLGTGGQTDSTLAWAHQKLTALPEDLVQQLQAQPEMREALPPVFFARLRQLTPLDFTISLTIVWSLSIWLFGRLARRVAGCAEGSRAALILFRLSPRYIFLLIGALALGILGSLPGGEDSLYVASPLIAMLAMAFAFEGLGVAIFFAALRRAAGEKTMGLILLIVAIVTLLEIPELLALVGLADHWFDFRRLNRIATLQAGQND